MALTINVREGRVMAKTYLREQHRMRNTPIYGVWCAMIRRCYNPNTKDYPRYGGRGIIVCERWRKSFEIFFNDMGHAPSGMRLDRKDNNGHYEPGNCRWVTPQVSNRNRRDNIYLEHAGERLPLLEWAKRTGLQRQTIQWRLKRGMSVADALTTPVRR